MCGICTAIAIVVSVDVLFEYGWKSVLRNMRAFVIGETLR